MKAFILLLLIPLSSYAQKATFAHECEVIMVGESNCGMLRSPDGNNIFSLIAPASPEGHYNFIESSDEIEDTEDRVTDERRKYQGQLKRDPEIVKNLLLACGPASCREMLAQDYKEKMAEKRKLLKKESKFHAQFLSLQRDTLESINTKDSLCRIGWTHSTHSKSFRANDEPIVSHIPTTGEVAELEVKISKETRNCSFTDSSLKKMKDYKVDFDIDKICKDINKQCPQPKKISGQATIPFEFKQDIVVYQSIEEAPLKESDSILISQPYEEIFLYRSQCDDTRLGKPIYAVTSTGNMERIKKIHREHGDNRVSSRAPAAVLQCD